MVNELIYNVLLALVVALIGIIAKTLLPYLKTKKDAAITMLRQTQWDFAADIIEAIVMAVEQTVSEEIHGQDKKDIAIKYIEDIVKQNNIPISSEQIDALIEAAVHEMNKGKDGVV